MRERTLKRLRALGEEICRKIEAGKFPELSIPLRSTRNIVFDKRLGHYVLGELTKVRKSSSLAHVRSFTQLVWVAYFTKKLLEEGRTTTLRDVYYSAQAFDLEFKSQDESNEVITDLEAMLGIPREDFNIYPEERSAVFGDLTIEYTVRGYEGTRLNLATHPDGVMIGHALVTSEFVETSAERVFVIEKGGIFTRFVEEGVHKRFKAILINAAGQAPRATRYFIRRLNQELGLPVYIFTDGDPWGMHIAMVIISGSANAAHIRGLATPSAKWLGVWASDIIKYKLPTDPFNEQDEKRIKELERDPRYAGELWQREIKKFKEIRRKAEQEAFSRYGLTYIVEKYLPEKMEIAETL